MTSTVVPWNQLLPEQTELIVSILLLRKHFPHAVRVRPAGRRGDGGIDVLVRVPGTGLHDVYQIKYFTKFDKGEQRQVRGSLERLMADTGLSVRAWYLTMPVAVTLLHREWLEDLQDQLGARFACEWLGKDNLDQLALEFPEVKDYYLEGGQARVTGAMHALTALLEASGQDLSPSGTAQKLRTIVTELNKSHPHVFYTLFADDPLRRPGRRRDRSRRRWWPGVSGPLVSISLEWTSMSGTMALTRTLSSAIFN